MIGANAATRLRDALSEERDALLNGNLQALAGIADRKERALARLAAQRPTEAELQTLMDLSAHNERLLNGASIAIGQVRDFAMRAQKPLETLTYGADGTRQALTGPSHGLTQKA
jgi:hypothetical protein